MEAAVKQESGMTGMMCAVLAGDLDMLKILVEHRADPNGRASGLADLGYYDTQTLLMVAVKSHQDTCKLERHRGHMEILVVYQLLRTFETPKIHTMWV